MKMPNKKHFCDELPSSTNPSNYFYGIIQHGTKRGAQTSVPFVNRTAPTPHSMNSPPLLLANRNCDTRIIFCLQDGNSAGATKKKGTPAAVCLENDMGERRARVKHWNACIFLSKNIYSTRKPCKCIQTTTSFDELNTYTGQNNDFYIPFENGNHFHLFRPCIALPYKTPETHLASISKRIRTPYNQTNGILTWHDSKSAIMYLCLSMQRG